MSDEAQPSKKPRRVRPAQTVREQAAKQAAAEPGQERGWFGALLHGFGAPARWAGRCIARVARGLGRVKLLHIVALILVPPYFRNSWRELRQVTWPTRRESRQLTTAVILFALVFGVAIAALDYGLDKVFKQVLLK